MALHACTITEHTLRLGLGEMQADQNPLNNIRESVSQVQQIEHPSFIIIHTIPMSMFLAFDFQLKFYAIFLSIKQYKAALRQRGPPRTKASPHKLRALLPSLSPLGAVGTIGALQSVTWRLQICSTHHLVTSAHIWSRFVSLRHGDLRR